jgi:dihydrofolate reductase
MRLTLIAAVAENGVIGAEGGMPWHYPADLGRFKETTMGHPVVMGRRTYESIASRLGGPLPGRTNVVLSRQADFGLPEGAVHAPDVEAALSAAETALEEHQETVYVAGGAAVYDQLLSEADELRITEIPERPDGDARFPEFGAEWVEVDCETAGELSFVTYRRR